VRRFGLVPVREVSLGSTGKQGRSSLTFELAERRPSEDGLVWSSTAKVDAGGLRLDSNELRPVVVRHYARAGPFLAVDVSA
jgi:hypothetical protein